jgi:hypothetical protein
MAKAKKCFSLDPELFRELEEFAREQRRNVSNAAEVLLASALRDLGRQPRDGVKVDA